MKVAIIGGGGREGSIGAKLAQSPLVTQMIAFPGNPGIAQLKLRNGWPVLCQPLPSYELEDLLEAAKIVKPDLTVVGPDGPIGKGIADLFRAAGFRIFAPNKKAARLESSKAYTQRFMEKYRIPCAKGKVFSISDPSDAFLYARDLHGVCVVKKDEPAFGKGAFPCSSYTEAHQVISLVVAHGEVSGAQEFVIQEFLPGDEASMHVLINGRDSLLFEASRDHKHLTADPKSFMTGGMGAFTPIPGISNAMFEKEANAILEPFFRGCEQEGIDYQGILYPGLVCTKEGMKVIEFNARFGDPEAQVYLPRLENDLCELLLAATEPGGLRNMKLQWKQETAITFVLTARGYPERMPDPSVIVGVEHASKVPNVKIFHAGTELVGQTLCVVGGRVLNVTALGQDLPSARTSALEAIKKIYFDGMHYREEIGRDL